MADISVVTAGRCEVIQSLVQATLPAAETIAAWAPVRIDTNGKFTNANGTTATEADLYGIATRSVVAGEAVTAVRVGLLDGLTLAGAYWSSIYLSNTDGRLADAAGTVTRRLGYVMPGWSQGVGTAADKVVVIDVTRSEVPSASTFAVASADGLTVNSVIVPATMYWHFSIAPLATITEYDLAVAERALKVVSISKLMSTLQGGVATATVVKATGTATPVKTTTPMHAADAIDLNAGAYTVGTITLTATAADLVLAADERIAIDLSTAHTVAKGVITVGYQYV